VGAPELEMKTVCGKPRSELPWNELLEGMIFNCLLSKEDERHQ